MIMKKLLIIACFLFIMNIVNAQDIITLKSGETISAKVSEIGINEIKYYKVANLQGPVYVTSKAEIFQITYANGAKDVFVVNDIQQSLNTAGVPQNTPQPVIGERRYRRRAYMAPIFIPHIDLGHHFSFGHHSGHHGHH